MSRMLLQNNLPTNFDKWNPALRGAYMKGRRARLDGAAVTDVPYKDKRKDDGRLTWSRSFAIAWRDGFRDMDRVLSEGKKYDA